MLHVLSVYWTGDYPILCHTCSHTITGRIIRLDTKDYDTGCVAYKLSELPDGDTLRICKR